MPLNKLQNADLCYGRALRMAALAAGIALLSLASPGWILPGARAALVLDQQYLANNGIFAGFSDGAGFRRAETFTVGVAGTLTDIDVIVFGVGSFTGINILSTVGGVPTTTIAAAGTFSSQEGDVAAFSVSLPVSIGEVLAIEPLQPNEGADWFANIPDTYAGGGDYFVNPTDGVDTFTASGLADDFRTFVTVVPEPDGLAVFGIGLLGLGLANARNAPVRAVFSEDSAMSKRPPGPGRWHKIKQGGPNGLGWGGPAKGAGSGAAAHAPWTPAEADQMRALSNTDEAKQKRRGGDRYARGDAD